MFDLTQRETYRSVEKWFKDLVKICPNIPICLVGNKADVKDRKLKARQITFHRKKNLQYYDVSAKSNYQFEKPFVWLLRQLVGDKNLDLKEDIPMNHPEIQMDLGYQQQIEQEMKDAELLANQNLPDMNEDFN